MALGPLMTRELERYGLSSLAGWLSTAIITGMGEDQLMLELYERPEFKTRFPAIAERRAAGLSPVSVDEYLEYEATARAAAKSLGVDITQDEINKNIAGDVSVRELVNERLVLASQAVHSTDPFLRQQLARHGVTTGDLTRYWLDPKESATVLKRRFAQASIAAEAQHAGFRPELSFQQLDYLTDRGLTPEQAASAFGKIVQSEELFEAVDDTEEDLGVGSQLEVLTGNVDETQKVQRRGERRAARFAEGGSFSTGRTGVSGLGSANT